MELGESIWREGDGVLKDLKEARIFLRREETLYRDR